FLVSAGVDKSVKLWELGGREGTPGYGPTKEISAVAVSPDGKLLASGSADNSVRVWDLATGRELFSLDGHTEPVTAGTFLPDSKTLVSGGVDQTMFVWDATTGKQLGAIRDDRKPILQVVAAGDGRRVAAFVDSGLVATYATADAKRVGSFEAGEQAG